MNNNKTIAAIASGITTSGIGVIRVSGPLSIRIVDCIFIAASGEKITDAKGYSAHFGKLICNGEMADEAVVIVFRSPHSFTGEDTVEIDSHGGPFVMKRILEELFKNGAVPAEPGEFTKRAFLNGKLDLSQAESVVNIINSTNDNALRASIGQLSGRLSEKIKEIREKLLYEAAYIESALDDPEHYSLDGYYDELSKKIFKIRTDLSVLIDSYQYGKTINDGIKTVIVGSPNVGKSSLLNALTGTDRAIVTDIAGTTRDILSERINVKGIPLNIIDTAGIHDSDDEIEKIGIDRAKENITDADLVLFVVDYTREMSFDENIILDELSEKIDSGRVILLVNKTDRKDLEDYLDISELKNTFGKRFLLISAKYGDGIDELRDMIYEMFSTGDISYNEEIIITSLRHYNLLCSAFEKLGEVINSIADEIPEDFISSDIMLCYEDLGYIIGEAVEDDIVNKIFKEFCMGK